MSIPLIPILSKIDEPLLRLLKESAANNFKIKKINTGARSGVTGFVLEIFFTIKIKNLLNNFFIINF